MLINLTEECGRRPDYSSNPCPPKMLLYDSHWGSSGFPVFPFPLLSCIKVIAYVFGDSSDNLDRERPNTSEDVM